MLVEGEAVGDVCACACPWWFYTVWIQWQWCGFSAERPLHFAEKVLPIVHGLGIDSHLVVKKYQSMEAMLLYLGK